MANILLVTLLGVFLRWCVSLYPYSGAGKPPMFGDYEAQRHWQEITLNLPVKDWYVNTTDNDLLYWGLDYPPLTAYHSYLCGLLAQQLNPAFVELHTSRGYESYEHKLFMRYTVFLIDLLIYIPAAYMFLKAAAQAKAQAQSGKLEFVALLLYPGLYLIDYGHFQYNNASLGLFVAAVAAFTKGQDCFGSVLFSLALNYKQMELYHALPIFFYLLGLCFYQNSLIDSLIKLAKISLSVIVTFAVLWSPFLFDLKDFFAVMSRLFPFNRGLFEDKVASFWCSLSIVVKMKNLVSNTTMALICFVSTVVCMMPSSLHLLIRPSPKILQHALVNSSLVFFLMSYHVHEKSILLAAIPACFLYGQDIFMVTWFLMVSVLSMLPLLVKDGLTIPALALTILLFIMFQVNRKLPGVQDAGRNDFKKWMARSFYLSMVGFVFLTTLSLTVEPPPRLPDLFPVLLSVFSCVHYCLFCLYFHYRQFACRYVPLKVKSKQKEKAKKH